MHSLSVSLTEDVVRLRKQGFIHLAAVSISNLVRKFCTNVILTFSSAVILYAAGMYFE
jgi:hypothetical protein